MRAGGRLSLVGSMNLDFLSMELLEEGCLVVDDRVFASEFERRWREDMARSRQVTGRRAEPSERRVEERTAAAAPLP